MPQKAFFIGPYEEGLTTSVKPWLLSEKAFADLNNVYVWRGRVKTRVGAKLFESTSFTGDFLQLGSRLRIKLGTTNGAGNLAGVCPGAVTGAAVIGQMFSIGTELYTVYQATGAVANMLKTGATTTATHNSATLAYNFAGAAAATDVYWYPAQPVMGIVNYEQIAINNEPTFAFDTQFAYQRTGNAWDRLGTATWTGNNYQFFWAANYRGTTNDDYVLYVVNYNRPDGIKYWNDSATPGAWAVITPATQAAPNYDLHTARILVSFKDRLVALNTIERVGAAGTYVTFAQRARWSQNGSPLAANAWYDNVPGLGGWIEAPTKEAIITARILKDRLIVYFERSTWELVYTGNQVLPFIWQVIDDQLGAESTFSSVLFDKVLLGIGETGVHACDGLHVIRIDDAIPQWAFQIHNENNGVDRVAGVRDYSNEMVYWAYPSALVNKTYPDKILAYNYKNGSYGIWDDSITAWGYYQNVSDITWGAASTTWDQTTRYWVAGSMQGLFKNVLAGNQEGFTFIMDSGLDTNCPALQITDCTVLFPDASTALQLVIIDHNLNQGDFIKIAGLQGTDNVVNNRNYRVYRVVDEDNIYVNANDGLGYPALTTYTGGGIATRVNKIDIKTKEYNFYPDAIRMAINKVDFDVDKTGDALGGFSIQVGVYTGTYQNDIGTEAAASGAALGTYTLDTWPYATLDSPEYYRQRIVHPVYIQAEGDCIQLQLVNTDQQLYDRVNEYGFELNSMTFYATPTARRL